MKRVLLSIILLVCVASFSYGRKVAEGESNTPLGKYYIEVMDEPVLLAGEEMNCYVITYENSPIELKVYVDKEKKCKNYLVVTDELSVMYTCNGEYFGVNLLDKKYKDAGLYTNCDNLNKSGFFHQKLIVRGETKEIDATKLIASFYPQLIQE